MLACSKRGTAVLAVIIFYVIMMTGESKSLDVGSKILASLAIWYGVWSLLTYLDQSFDTGSELKSGLIFIGLGAGVMIIKNHGVDGLIGALDRLFF